MFGIVTRGKIPVKLDISRNCIPEIAIASPPLFRYTKIAYDLPHGLCSFGFQDGPETEEIEMRAVVQRVRWARVAVEGEILGEIGPGLLVFLGVGQEDQKKDAEYLGSKVIDLRIFQDSEGKMNRSIREVGGSLLVISQFTLYGDCRKGRRPAFIEAASPEQAENLYSYFISWVRSQGAPTAQGRFQAMMEVSSLNDGPVTILLDSHKLF